LLPGHEYRGFLSQSGQLTVHAFRVSLVCEESATYRQGTNTRTENQEVYRQELLKREGLEIKRIQPFEAEFEFHVPEGVMHSFISEHNQINWTLVVDANVAKWPDFQRAFTVVIRPVTGELSP
jgi:hypothetical protein